MDNLFLEEFVSESVDPKTIKEIQIFDNNKTFDDNNLLDKLDDYDINRSHDLTYILNLYHSPGDTITFEILRNGDVIYLDFILGTR